LVSGKIIKAIMCIILLAFTLIILRSKSEDSAIIIKLKNR